MDILIIDDDPISIFLAKLLLNRCGLFDNVTAYHNPVEALLFIQDQIDSNMLPQVILLDINMPLLDGWELLEKLKPCYLQLSVKNSIYMLTSSTDISDINRAKDHQLVTDILFKPLAIGKIQEIYKHVRLFAD